jgi:hypothetical protein
MTGITSLQTSRTRITSLFMHDVHDRGIAGVIREALDVVGDGPTFLTGMDIVEVIPTGIGSTGITALVAARTVHETLTGLALARARQPVDLKRRTSRLP